jgi:hypothetical protein
MYMIVPRTLAFIAEQMEVNCNADMSLILFKVNGIADMGNREKADFRSIALQT